MPSSRADARVRMDETDRPPLGPYAYEKIAKKCHEIERGFWDELSKMRVESPYFVTGPSPASPKLPEHLRAIIIQYAGSLFGVEATEYPESPKIEFWLSRLAERVVEKIMNTLDVIDQASYDFRSAKYYSGLSWHGLTREEMRDIAWQVLEDDKASILRDLEPESVHDTSFPDSEPSQTITSSEELQPDAGGIVEHRNKLLEVYKSATGQPSSKQIYEASNSGIHKPEFYQWKQGKLPVESRITKRFEAFLKSKRRPIPRNPTT
jgi:hypothetical protein